MHCKIVPGNPIGTTKKILCCIIALSSTVQEIKNENRARGGLLMPSTFPEIPKFSLSSSLVLQYIHRSNLTSFPSPLEKHQGTSTEERGVISTISSIKYGQTSYNKVNHLKEKKRLAHYEVDMYLVCILRDNSLP